MGIKVFESNTELTKQINNVFYLDKIRKKLLCFEKEDKQYYLNLIITTLLIDGFDNKYEAIGFVETIKSGIIKHILK